MPHDAIFQGMDGPNAIFQIEKGSGSWTVEALPFYEVDPRKEGKVKEREQLRERLSRLRPGSAVTVVFADLHKNKGAQRAGAVLHSVAGNRYRVRFSALKFQQGFAEFKYEQETISVKLDEHSWLMPLLLKKTAGDWMVGDFLTIDPATRQSVLLDMQDA